MKRIKMLFTLALAFAGMSAFAQDFSDPRYAKWGDTPEERRENILNSSFLKEEIDNRNYDLAAGYLQKLLAKCPSVSENIYANGIKLYKQKINRAQTLDEKNVYVDSLLMLYDLRLQYFGSHPERGKDYILERKAREYLTYKDSDREGIRKAFEAAIAAQVEKTGTADPEVVAIYFKNLCDDYTNDVVDAMTVVNAYDANSKYFENLTPDKQEYKNQFETCFGLSGAANCDNIQEIFSKKLAEDPENETLMAQAMSLMMKAKCDNDFFFHVGEKYYAKKPTSDTAMLLAEVYQNQKNFDKANEYLRKALDKETDNAMRETIFVRIGILEMAAEKYAQAVEALRQARDLNPENGYVYYFLAQCYVQGSRSCAGISKDATYWVAYDMLQHAIPLLSGDEDTVNNARSLASSYRTVFPTAEECFFNELEEGSTYTLDCGFASGISTKVRYRAQ